MDIYSQDAQLKENLKRRVEAPSFGTVFFAGIAAGQAGFLTRGLTKKAGKYVLGQISDRLLKQQKETYSAIPVLQRELGVSALSPVQQLTYYGITKAQKPQSEQSALAYVPLQLTGQAIQLAAPARQQAFAQRYLTPEIAEKIALQPETIQTSIRRYTSDIAQQFVKGKQVSFQEGIAGQFSNVGKIFTRQFWAQAFQSTKESVLVRYQQGALGIMSLAKFYKEYGPSKAVKHLALEEVERRLKTYGRSAVAEGMGLEPVRLIDIIGEDQVRDLILAAYKGNKVDVLSVMKRLAGTSNKIAKMPIGYGIYKKPSQTIKSLSDIYIIPSWKLSLTDMQLRQSKQLHIPYLSFNPLRLFIPPTLEESIFGEVIRPTGKQDVVPTLLGAMGQGTAQELQYFAWYGSQQKLNSEVYENAKRLNELLNKAGNLSKRELEEVKYLQQSMRSYFESINKQPDAQLVIAGKTPVAVWKNQAGGITQSRVSFMLPGYAVPVEETGSGLYRQYHMMLGTTIRKQQSDIAFSQQYNLQPNLLQQLAQMVKYAITGDESQKAIFEQASSGQPDQQSLFGHIGDVLQKLRQSGYFREQYSKIDIKQYSDKEILEIIEQTFGLGEGATKKTGLLRFAIEQVGKLEPQEKSVISELEQQFSRNIITEEWLSTTVKTGGRTRREILQEIIFFNRILSGLEDVGQIKDKPVAELLGTIADQYQSAQMFKAKEAENILSSILDDTETLKQFQLFSKKRFAGLKSLLKAEQDVDQQFTQFSNQFLYIPSMLSQEELSERSIKAGFIEQLFPGALRKMTTLSEVRGLITEPGLMLTHFAYRPVELMETLGLGGIDFSKVHNALDIMQRTFTRKIFPVMAGIASFYTIDQLLGIGSPTWSLVSDLYVGGISLLNLTGIGPLGRYIHTHAPSLLSTVGQAVGLYATGDVTPQFVMGQLGQLIERTPTSKEQQIQQEGLGLVEKRKSAGWEFGRGPYWGSKTQYYRPFLPYLQEKEWQFTENVYGSKFEYMAFGFPFPNPFNLFGLTWLMDPYHYERERFYYRPYPISGPMPFTEIPLLGPFLSPISYMLKPTTNLVQANPQGMIQAQQGTSGFTYMALQREYMQEYGTGYFDLSSGTFSHVQLPKQLQDYLGIIGFQTTQFTAEQFAGEQEYYSPKLQHSGTWGSVERMYYMSKLGNIFGMSEFVRRMIPHDEAGYPQFNPVPNQYLSQFSWLPDRYKTGDQYQTMDFGEVRLPGPQYEKTRYMVDQYGPIDQFLILQNVQPYSQQYEFAKKNILSMLEERPQDFSEMTRFLIQQQIENAENVRRGLDEYQKVYTKQTETIELQLGEYLGNGMFTVQGQSYLARVNGIVANEDELAYQIYKTTGASFEEQYQRARQIAHQINSQLQEMSKKTVKVRVLEDEMARFTYTEQGNLILEVGMPQIDVPREARKYDTQMQYSTNGFNLLRQFWDVQSQFVPQTFMFEKFFQYREPLELYERYSAVGKYRMLWHRVVQYIIVPNFNILTLSNPVSAFLGGVTTGLLSSPDTITRYAAQAIGGIQYAGQSLFPQRPSSETQQRWEFEKQMDYLQMLQDNMRGSKPRSLLGMRTVQGYQTLYKNVPLEYKQYIPSIVNVAQEDMDRVRTMLPDYVMQVVQQTWDAKQRAIERQRQGQSLEFRTQVENIVNDVDAEEYLEELGDSLQYIDMRAYRQMNQLQQFSDVTKLSVTPQSVYQQLITTLDQEYMTRTAYSTAQFNSEYMRQMYQSQQYQGQQRVVLGQNRRQSTFNYTLR